MAGEKLRETMIRKRAAARPCRRRGGAANSVGANTRHYQDFCELQESTFQFVFEPLLFGEPTPEQGRSAGGGFYSCRQVALPRSEAELVAPLRRFTPEPRTHHDATRHDARRPRDT